jgi:hypothetical protein
MGNASEPYQRRALHPSRTGLPLIIAHIAGPDVDGLVSNDLSLETSCIDFLVYASAGMITV